MATRKTTPAPQVSEELDAEGAVRLYLMWTENPAALRDEAKLVKLSEAIAGAKDPIDRAKLMAEKKRAEAVDGDAFRRDFVKYAWTWADENQIPVSVLQELGVNDVVLAEAGFDLGLKQRSVGRTRKATAPVKARAKSVSAQTIREHLETVTGSFTLQDIMADIGGSPATVTKVVASMVSEGSLKSLGPDPSHSGKGKRPNRYSL